MCVSGVCNGGLQCKVRSGNLQCRCAVPRSIRSAGKYNGGTSNVDGCLKGQCDLKIKTPPTPSLSVESRKIVSFRKGGEGGI